MAIATIINENTKVLQLIQTLFKEGTTNEGKSIEHVVKDKHEGMPMTIEVNDNTAGTFVLFRVITSAGYGLWNTWDSPDEVKNTFRTMSLI